MRTPLITWSAGLVIGAVVLITPPTTASSAVSAVVVDNARQTPPSRPTKLRGHSGYDVYMQHGCGVCHGADAAGTSMGPSLLDVQEFWTDESLALYLANPDSTSDVNPRLKAVTEQYRRFKMPPFELDREEINALSTFLLDPR